MIGPPAPGIARSGLRPTRARWSTCFIRVFPNIVRNWRRGAEPRALARQESISEAVNAYYGVYLQGEGIEGMYGSISQSGIAPIFAALSRYCGFGHKSPW